MAAAADPASASKGEQTRERLRRVAAAEFARRGFHDTKVSDIVAGSGLTQPTFYVYFRSKEAAYDELVGLFRDRLEALIRSLLIEPGIAPETVIALVTRSFRAFLDFLAEDRELTEIGFFQPPGSSLTKDRMAGWIAANIAKEQASGLFRPDIPAELIGECFVGMVERAARRPGDATSRATQASGCARLLCEGIWTGAHANARPGAKQPRRSRRANRGTG